jgi:ubiquinone/menaquinone biosynthesis C-methylase UbiE
MIKKIITKVLVWNLSHNFLFNKCLIALKLDKKVASFTNPYLTLKPNLNKGVQENAGYSLRPEINEVLEKSKNDLLNCVATNLKNDDEILEIGCGPGMYLSILPNLYKKVACDINEGLLEIAKKQVSSATFYKGNFSDITFKESFNFIYCIGVLVYFTPTELKHVLTKAHQLLNKDGILYINYPHAISKADTQFANLTYLHYSPAYIEKLIQNKFEIITHHHAFDGRIIEDYDKQPYKSLNPNTKRTYKNSYLLIAKKITV